MSKRYWEWGRVFTWDPETTALLVIDMQQGFLVPGSALEVPMARAQLPAISRLIRSFRERGLPVLYTRFVVRPDEYVPFYRSIAARRGIDVSATSPWLTTGDHAAIADELQPADGEPVVDKVAYDGFADTALEGLLRTRGVETVVLVGTVVNWCVDSTLRSAFHRRFNCIVVADGVSGYDHAGASGEQWVAQELDHFAEAFATVTDTETLVRALDDPELRRADPPDGGPFGRASSGARATGGGR